MKKAANLGLAIGLAIITLFTALISLALVALPEADVVQAQNTNRRQVTILASAQRTSTTTSDDILNLGENLNVRGAYLFIDVTGVQTTPLVTPSIQAIDPVSGDYISVFTATAGISSSAVYLLVPGVGTAADGVTQVRGFPLPANWRVRVAHADTDPITYSVGALLVP